MAALQKVLAPGGKWTPLGYTGTPSSRGARPRWFPRAPAPWEALSPLLWAPADVAVLRSFKSVVYLVQSSERGIEVKSSVARKLSSRELAPLPTWGHGRALSWWPCLIAEDRPLPESGVV